MAPGSATSMRAVFARHPGPASSLRVEQVPCPVPGPRQVLIQVAAAGINRPDVFQRMGHYPPPKGAPESLGLEVAGTVAALGEGAARFRVGDRVCALVPGGGYADYAVADDVSTLPVPGALSMVEAAALPETFFTVWSNVFQRGRLAAGETLLVHGGSSGIGTTAIMLAKAFGARVVATAGSPEKCRAIAALGADLAVNYREEDFVEAVKGFGDGHGADVILDMVGGDYAARNHKAAAMDGRIVQIAVLNGARAEIDLRAIMMKRLIHTGSTLRARPPAEKGAIAQDLEARVWPLLEAGRCRPVIERTFALEEAASAHALMETSGHVGKIVLTL